jgi:hypothetical protein
MIEGVESENTYELGSSFPLTSLASHVLSAYMLSIYWVKTQH